MRRQFSTTYIVGLMLIIVSCSSPRYSYNFDYYDYNSGRKQLPSTKSTEPLLAIEIDPLKLEKNEMVASADGDAKKSDQRYFSDRTRASAGTVKDLSKEEVKKLRSELKHYIKGRSKKMTLGNEPASANATNQLDDDLKLAIIFGAVGITFAILGGINTVFWVIGVIGLIVGLVFFIRWISTQ